MAIEELQNGRYSRIRLLGSGGMGEVYLMQDNRVNRQVGIKVIRSEGASYPDSDAAKDAARLFQREARAIAALEHPNILPLYDFGEEVSDGATITYMVMPYCADGSLNGWLRQRGSQQLSAKDIAYLVEQAADALEYAHDHEVIHLDVKPSNFLLRSNRKNPNRPTLLLADFGIARSATTLASSSRTIRGTPTSMAPEQWSSNPVAATDQYALAVMVYELLTGRPPFIGSMEQLMFQHFSAQPPAPSSFNPRLPEAVDAVLLRALAKKPEDRFPSITDFANAYKQAVGLSPAEAITDSQPLDADLYTTLSISQEEANAGISQVLTLPGGKKVDVSIPAGAQDGQIIRVQDPNASDNSVIDMVLTVSIKKPAQLHLASDAGNSTPSLPISDSMIRPASDPISGHDLPTVSASELKVQTPGQPPVSPPKRPSALRFGAIAIISLLVIVLLLTGTLYYVNTHQNAHQAANTNTAQHAPTATVAPTLAPTPSPTPTPQKGLYIAGSYGGSMTDNTTQQSTSITVFLVQTQGQAPLKGSVTFRSSQGVQLLNGTVDTQGNFSFTVQQPSGKTPLYFYGTYQSSYLKGNYCSSSTGPCLAITGFFTVGPRS